MWPFSKEKRIKGNNRSELLRLDIITKSNLIDSVRSAGTYVEDASLALERALSIVESEKIAKYNGFSEAADHVLKAWSAAERAALEFYDLMDAISGRRIDVEMTNRIEKRRKALDEGTVFPLKREELWSQKYPSQK